MKIENTQRADRDVIFGAHIIRFDEKEIAEVEDAVGAKLTKLGGYHTIGRAAAKAGPAPKAEEDAPVSLESMNTAQLKKLAREMDIEIGDAAKKAELIALIEKAQG